MRQILLSFFILVFLQSFAQNQILPFSNGDEVSSSTTPTRTVYDEGPNGVNVNYSFSGAILKQLQEDDDFYHLLTVENFSHLQEIGKPAIPAKNDIILIPEGEVQLLTFKLHSKFIKLITILCSIQL